MLQLNTPIVTDRGLMTAIKTEQHGMEVYVLVLQSSTSNTIIGRAMSERGILNLGYKAIFGATKLD
jgi:hypothetical protein